MGEYDFIINGIRWSFSSLTTFEQCPWAFKLAYIDLVDRGPNFFSDYGKLIHTCLEKYFKGELDAFELSDFYNDNFDTMVTTPPPPFPAGMAGKYRDDGARYFDYFYFPKHEYEILGVEESVEFEFHGSQFIAKPDLIIKNIKSGKTSMVDFKTSKPFRGDVPDKKKVGGYWKQLYTYAYALKTVKDFKIDTLEIWFPRVDKKLELKWYKSHENKAVSWLKDTIDNIRAAEIFPYNNKETYFCQNICGVRDSCIYKPE